MMGGISGSGKSTARDELGLNNFVTIDADEIRKQLPEYEGWNSALTQDEVDDITAELVHRAMKERKNVLLDSTMKTYNKFLRYTSIAKALDYKIQLTYVDAPVDKAMRNVVQRYRETGRYVDLHYVASQDHRNRETFEKLKRFADDWRMYDASGPKGVLKERKSG
jgi:predicted ABC-type ATPase